MTSNIGAKKVSDFGNGIGFTTSSSSQQKYEVRKSIIQKSLKQQFAPEFLNRIDDIILFNSLDKEILKKNGHKGVHGYFKFDKITKVATPYYRHDKELKQSLIKKDKTMFKRSSGVSPDKRVVAEHNRYEYFDLLEKFMIKRVPIVSLNESVVLPLDESLETRMKTLIEQLKNK
jgi:hypothetical protein